MDSKLLYEYNDLIRKHAESGIIEKVSPNDNTTVGNVHYIPHHPVIRRDKETTKVLVVYDASAKKYGPSLNDCISTDPSLLPKIMEILLRFRYHKITLVADVEKAFHQVSVIWVDDIISENPKLLIYCFTRVVFGVNASPFLLNMTIDYHIRSHHKDPKFVQAFLSSLYVDDLNEGGNTVEDVFDSYQKASQRISEGWFTLRKGKTNNSQLRRKINLKEESTETDDTTKVQVNEDKSTYASAKIGRTREWEPNSAKKVLGIYWNTHEDQLVFDTSTYLDSKNRLPITKRPILKIQLRCMTHWE